MTTILTAPSPGQTFVSCPSGATYKADASGNVAGVSAVDVVALLDAGCTFQNSGSTQSSSQSSGSDAVISISSCGSSQIMALPSGVANLSYDLTTSTATALSLSGGTAGQLCSITVRLKLGAGGSYILPPNAAWPNTYVPTLNTVVGLHDVLQFSTLDGGATWEGAAVSLAAQPSSLSVAAISGTIYAGAALSVAGSYFGTPPSNIDYSLDGGAFATLGAGGATLTNGAFSFTLTAPAAGSHTIQIRATGTQEASNVQSFAIAAAAVPAAPQLAVSPGNVQNILTWTDGSANGAVITSHNLYRGTTAGGEALIGSITTGSPYTDTGLTNGVTYYYKLSAVNSVGASSQSAEASATPAAGAVSAPAHYLSLTQGTLGNCGTSPTTANDTTTGFLDLQVWFNFTTYVASSGVISLINRYTSGTASKSNSAYVLGISTGGQPIMYVLDGAGTFSAVGPVSAPTLASLNPSVTTGIWVRSFLNKSTAAVTTGLMISGSAFVSPAGSYAVFTSLDGSTWTQFGSSQTGLAQTGINALGATATGPCIGAYTGSNTTYPGGKVYKAVVQDTTKILFNPDFTVQSTGATSFIDTAPTPNTYSYYQASQA